MSKQELRDRCWSKELFPFGFGWKMNRVGWELFQREDINGYCLFGSVVLCEQSAEECVCIHFPIAGFIAVLFYFFNALAHLPSLIVFTRKRQKLLSP